MFLYLDLTYYHIHVHSHRLDCTVYECTSRKRQEKKITKLTLEMVGDVLHVVNDLRVINIVGSPSHHVGHWHTAIAGASGVVAMHWRCPLLHEPTIVGCRGKRRRGGLIRRESRWREGGMEAGKKGRREMRGVGKKRRRGGRGVIKQMIWREKGE